MALVDDFKERFPEFSTTVVDQRVPIFANVYSAYFVGDYTDAADKEAILNLVAHLLVLDQASGAGATAANGGVASKSVGSVSVSYAAAHDQSSLRDFFGGSKYGAQFLLLTAHRRGGHFV